MDKSEISIAPLNPVIGAEVTGLDLSEPLGPETFKKLHAAWLEHLVLFFRDQELTLEQHKNFGRLWGELHVHPSVPSLEGHPEILVIRTDENSMRAAGHGWHSDVSCEAEPPKGSILRLEQVPDSGGDTLFASMYACYEALSEHWQRFLSSLTAIHENEHVHGRPGYGHKKDREFRTNEHPVVRTHPETGRKALYVNSGFTTRIRGMRPAESRATLGFLYQHIQQPDFHCRFSWRPNSVAFWDNRCAQHHATYDYHPQVRHGYRVTVMGDRPS